LVRLTEGVLERLAGVQLTTLNLRRQLLEVIPRKRFQTVTGLGLGAIVLGG